jgi:hypothetical protein
MEVSGLKGDILAKACIPRIQAALPKEGTGNRSRTAMTIGGRSQAGMNRWEV